MHPRAAPDDLLELGHGADFAVEHDQAAGLRVDPGGEQARGGDDHRVGRLGVNKVAELRGAFGIIAGDAHDVARVLPGEVGVFIEQGLTHARGVFGVNTENDGLLPAVAAMLEEVRYQPGDAPGALVNDQVTVKIFLVVETVFDLVALLVGFARPGAVALHIHIQMYLDDLVRSQETVADALLERIRVDRRAQVVDVGNVGGFSGRGGQADLRRR